MSNKEKKIPWWRKARSLSPPKEEDNDKIVDNLNIDKCFSGNFLPMSNYTINKKPINSNSSKNTSPSSDTIDDVSEHKLGEQLIKNKVKTIKYNENKNANINYDKNNN